jgi:competence protein ComEA
MLGDGGSRGTAAIWIAAALLGGIALLRLGGGERDAAPAAPVQVERRAPRAEPRQPIFVHVAGAVRRPGLIRVPEGTRVAVALRRAGGPMRKAELSGVNLAAKLEDGQQVIVPGRAPPTAAGAAAAGAALGPPGGGAKLSLAAATQAELEEIDGIGPTLAGRIIEFRTEQGGVGSIEELGEVDGIGEKRLEALREALQP